MNRADSLRFAPVSQRNAFIATFGALALVAACGPGGPPGGGSETKEAWDIRNDPRIFELEELNYSQLTSASALKGLSPHKPWPDSYWPFLYTGLARRYHDDRKFTSFASQRNDLASTEDLSLMSPAEKFDLWTGKMDKGLTRHSWAVHDHYQDRYPHSPVSWAWMGHCAGWASAASRERAPRHHVLAKSFDGRDLLFFEGDLRALLTKAYDESKAADGRRMIGQRCDDAGTQIPRDDQGRVIDGRFAESGTNFYILRDESWRSGALIVTEDPHGSDSYYMLLKEPQVRLRGDFAAYVYEDKEDLVQDVRNGQRGQRANREVTAHFYKACRDVNPAALHSALVGRLSSVGDVPKGSFVLETNWDAQVWNYPIWGFKAEISPLRDVSSDPASLRVFRAPGTRSVAEVRTTLILAKGVPAAREYPVDGPADVDWLLLRPGKYHWLKTYEYTLEFDQDGRLIGGEWEHSAGALDSRPDFLWYPAGELTDRNWNGSRSLVPISRLRRLLACSQQSPDARVTVDFPEGAQEVRAVRCYVE